MSQERLQKVLARAGVASRRGAETLIERGRVAVDGRVVTELGTKVDPRRQRVEVDGQRVDPEPLVYVVLNKPRGVVSTMRDPEGRPTVAELVRRAPSRVVPVGRLDFHTSGVLLLTNDGDFARALAHPSKGVRKVYVAKVPGNLGDEEVERFGRSVSVEGRRTRPAAVRRLRVVDGKTWLEIVLHEGKNRQIRRLGEAAGHRVMRLSRLEFAGVTAEGLRPGDWRYLTRDELKELKQSFGVPRKIVSPPQATAARPRRAGAGARGDGARSPKRAPSAGSSSASKPRATRPSSGSGKRGSAARPSSRRKSPRQ